MAYCKQCGAYLPDGQSVCLACGFDEQAKSGTATATQHAKKSQTDTERLRKQMEEQRARVREQSKKWAEQEAQRRKAQQEQEARQESETFVEKEEKESHIPYARQGSAASSGTTVSSSKLMAVLSYLSVLCFIPLLACKDDDFAMFHAKQGLSLFIFTSIGNILGGILGFGWLFTIAQIFFIFKGIGNANAGIKEPLPYIGTLFKF